MNILQPVQTTINGHPPAPNPVLRPRRMRISPALRRMVRETTLSPADFIYPLFVRHGRGERRPISSMPGQFQLSVDELVREADSILELGIPAVLLFGIPAEKDWCGSDNFNPHGVVPEAIRALKAAAPELIVISDMCFCEYTDHGHCGLINTPTLDSFNAALPEGYLLNDPTLELIGRASVVHAEAGADIISASDTSSVEVTKDDLDANKLKYRPPANAYGNPDPYTSFTFKVNDGLDDSALAYTMNINVTAVNDAPVISSGSSTLSVVENTDTDANPLWTYRATDEESDPVQWRVGETDSKSNDSEDFTIVDGELSFSSPRNFEDPKDGNKDNKYEVRVEVYDDDYDADYGGLDVMVEVTNVDDTEAADDVAVAIVNTAGIVINVLANDSHAEGVTLTVLSVSDPPNGDAAVTATRTAVTYTPNADFTGTDTFRYNVSGGGTEDTGEVTVTVRLPDRTRPRVTITSAASAPVGGPFTVTITFSESVSGFSLTDISVSNGTASRFKKVSSRTYTATITPAASGPVEVAVGANVARDQVGNRNQPAESFVIAADLERPTVTIEGPTEPVGLAEFAVTITFSEPVEDFEQADLQISNGMVTAFTAVSPTEYRATITPEASGAVRVEVGPDVAEDETGNGNQPAAFVIAAALQGRFGSPAVGTTVSGIDLIRGGGAGQGDAGDAAGGGAVALVVGHPGVDHCGQ